MKNWVKINKSAVLLRVFLCDLRLSQRKWLRFESESWYSAFTFKQSGAISAVSQLRCQTWKWFVENYRRYSCTMWRNFTYVCMVGAGEGGGGGGNFVPCHYNNVYKISSLCKAISSLSLEVSSLNLVSYCKLPLLSPRLSAGTAITKKQRKQTLQFSWGLYCLFVMFLLLYVICASLTTEGTYMGL